MDAKDRYDSIAMDGVDLPERTLFLTGDIDYEMAQRVQAGLGVLSASGAGVIRVVLSSNGGDEDAGFLIFEAIRGCANRVLVIGSGSVMSVAALILQAGDWRLLTPACRVMVHGGNAKLKNNIHQQMHVVEVAKEMEVRTRQYATLIAERAGLKPSRVMSWCRRDKFFSADEAVRMGLADGVAHPPFKKKGKS
jgi:ATP-dependent Clp protease protease subunit